MLVAALMPMRGSAHALDPGFLELGALGQDRWRVTWRVPDLNGKPMPILAELPEGCAGEAPALQFDGRAWSSVWIATCAKGLQGGAIRIRDLERTRTEALVRYELQPGETRVRRLTPGETGFAIPADAGVPGILQSYVSLGVSHILQGIDHLLFVFALLLLVRDRARLFWAITAFTLAHSLTLAAAALGWLSVAPPPVEAVIALSIVFLAYELALPPRRRDPLAERWPWLVSFAFGLIHGLGFAGALREIGLPEGDIPLALFAFNLGVELGQILFIGLVVLVAMALTRLYPGIRRLARQMTRAASYAIGSLAAFWVIQRLAGF
ncbi:HupE/UreJ family protein [Paracoccus sp. XHP0099]|uniref:HupE/UreJ family protein n=2 Tax=Paracoccus marinaquae TaxID=2841926 RepID=A0ABS6AHV3_9RHOB|nr:HupE/UreJ family protein [Paracoccus marinaquae]